MIIEKQNNLCRIVFGRVESVLKIETQNSQEHRMVELKAKVRDHEFLKRKLSALGAKYIGTLKQSDLYFKVPEGKLKLREMEGNAVAELIYYHRENIAGPKSDDAYLLRVQDSKGLKKILKKILTPTIIVKKVREIYRYQGTHIHLDTVSKLGRFVEFERPTSKDSRRLENDRRILKRLLRILEIDPENLVTLSYGDLLN